jgi:hypothetical protein
VPIVGHEGEQTNDIHALGHEGRQDSGVEAAAKCNRQQATGNSRESESAAFGRVSSRQSLADVRTWIEAADLVDIPGLQRPRIESPRGAGEHLDSDPWSETLGHEHGREDDETEDG